MGGWLALGTALLKSELAEFQPAYGVKPAVREPERIKEAAECFSKALGLFGEGFDKEAKKAALVNRAKAYVLLGKEDEARSDLKCASEALPSDPDVAQAYAVFLEDQGEPDAAIEVLTEAYRSSKSCENGLILASLLDHRNQPGDRARAVDVLRQAVDCSTEAIQEVRFDIIFMLAGLLHDEGCQDGARKTIEELPPGYLEEAAVRCIQGMLAKKSGRNDAAISATQDAAKAISGETPWSIRRAVALFLTGLQAYSEALPLWEHVVEPSYVGPDTYSLLQCASKAGDLLKVLAFCEALRANGLYDQWCLDLELGIRERFDPQSAKAVLQAYLQRFPDDRRARLRLSLLGIHTGDAAVVEKNGDRLPSAKEAVPQIGLMTARLLRHIGEVGEAVRYAYELYRRHRNDPVAHRAVAEAILAPFGPEPRITNPETVVPGSAVLIQETGSDTKRWWVIEDDPEPEPDVTEGEIRPDHPLAQAMMGAKPDDEFVRPSTPLCARAKILKILSKYVLRMNQCIEMWEARFPGEEFVHRFDVATSPDSPRAGEEMLAQMAPMVERRVQTLDEMHALYRENPLPANFFASNLGSTVFEAQTHLASTQGIGPRCCLGNVDERETALRHLRAANTLVIDPTALCTIALLGLQDDIKAWPVRCMVGQATLQELRDLIREKGASRRVAGHLQKLGTRVVFVPSSESDWAKGVEWMEGLLRVVETQCTVEGGIGLAGMEEGLREELIQVLGQATAESAVLARGPGRVLWTDDLVASLLASAKLGVRCAWTQATFMAWEEAGHVETSVSHEVSARLLGCEYAFTSLSDSFFLCAVRLSSWDIRQWPLNRVLEHFASEEIPQRQAIRIAGICIKRTLREAGVRFAQALEVAGKIVACVGRRRDGKRIITALLGSCDGLFGMDVVNLGVAVRILRDWLNRHGEKRGIIT